MIQFLEPAYMFQINISVNAGSSERVCSAAGSSDTKPRPDKLGVQLAQAGSSRLE